MLVMDLDDPVRADVVHAIGVTSLQFEPTMGYRFMAGMENGVVVNVNRRTTSPTEKLAYRFSCHRGPVIAIDRNPFTPKNFLTVGDCTAKIWADDTREDSLITIRFVKINRIKTSGQVTDHSVLRCVARAGSSHFLDICYQLKPCVTLGLRFEVRSNLDYVSGWRPIRHFTIDLSR